MNDLKAAAPAPVQDHKTAEDMVEIDRSQIMQSLGGQTLSTLQRAVLAKKLGISGEQMAALAAGTANLRMTGTQYAELRGRLAKEYAQSMDNKSGGGGGSLCGSSSSPEKAPEVPAAKQVPPNESIHSNHPLSVEGNEIHSGKVDGGTVTLRVGAQEPTDATPDNFVITYKGTDAKNEHWLQFIHREVVGIHEDKSAHPITDSISTSGTRGGSYKLTAGGTETTNGAPKAENYNTDSTSSSDPFYEAGGTSNRTADSTQMIDMPGSAKAKVSAAFAAGAKKVVSRAHFDTYLVHVDKVTYHVQVSVVWTFNNVTDTPSPTMTTEGGGAAANLPSEIQKKFHAQYPDFNFIK